MRAQLLEQHDLAENIMITNTHMGIFTFYTCRKMRMYVRWVHAYLTIENKCSSGDLHEHYDSKAIVDGKPVFSLPSHMLQVCSNTSRANTPRFHCR
jgi:hypothetical protein